MRAGPLSALLGLLLAALTSTARSASAQPASSHEVRAARLITLAVATDTDADVTQIVDYLRPLLDMRGLLLTARRVDSVDSASSVRSGSPPGVRARVWLDLTTPGRALVSFAAGDQRTIVAREVPTAAHIDQVAAAEIAEIILAALMAPDGAFAAPAASGERLDQLAATPPAGVQPARWQRSLGGLAGAQSWAAGASVIPEVGLSALFEWRSATATWSWALWSTLRYRPPFEPVQSPLRVRVRGGEAELLGMLVHGLGRRGSLGLGAGLGIDARFVDPLPAAGTTLANPQSLRELAPFLRAAVRCDLRLHGPLSLFAALTLDLFPLQGRLMVDQSGAARAVFTPWPLRPGAVTGASLVF